MEDGPRTDLRRAYTAGVLAWVVPGGGHLYLGRRWLGAIFLLLVVIALAAGCAFDGELTRTLSGSPLKVLRTFGCLGMGLPYFVLWASGYTGDTRAPGFEYGSAFLVTAGLMNLLLVIDVWDIARGKK